MVLFNVYWLLQTVVAVTLSLTVTAEAISAKSRSNRSKSDYDNFEQMGGRANTNDYNNHHIDAMPAIGTNGGSTQNPDKTPIELLRPCSGWRGSTLLGYAPGSMGSYALAASLTINACLVVYFFSVRVVSVVSTRLSERYSVAMTVRNLAEDHPWIIGKVVTEQLFTWILILVSLGFLIATDITEFPFYGSNCTDVISIAFSVNVGRYIWRMLQDAYLREHLKRCWISCLHHLVAVLCYSIMLHYGENLFLGSFGIFMEGNTFCFDILWIFKFCEMSLDNKVYFFFAVMALVFSVCLRFLVPISATVYACVKQSPLSMHPVPLATLFLAGVFFTAINIWVTYSSVSKIRKSYEAKKVAKLQTIVKSKVPDLMKQNILSTGTPLADILSQRNSASGDYTASYYNNINDTNHKIDKTPFNILMQYHDESGSERDADFTNRRGRYLRGARSRSDSGSSISTFIGDSRLVRQAEINIQPDAEEFEEIPLSSV